MNEMGGGGVDVSSTSLVYVEGIQAHMDGINNKKHGAISPCMSINVDKVGKILISDSNGEIALSENL